MPTAIKLDNDLGLMAAEVDNVVPNNDLLSKLVAMQIVSA
jgi:hypothetical protein